MEYELCFTYEPGDSHECCGASGRKFRQVCVYCPNYELYLKRTKSECQDSCPIVLDDEQAEGGKEETK